MKRNGLLLSCLLGLALFCAVFTSDSTVIRSEIDYKNQVLHFAGQTADTPSLIKLTPTQSRILRLKSDAASVVVSNPSHASVLLDTPRVLVVIPRAPGATSFTVLDQAGAVIGDYSVVVTDRSDAEQYVRVRRVCGVDERCVPSAVYYCPEGCHEIATQGTETSTSGFGGGGGGGAASGGGAPSLPLPASALGEGAE